MAARMTSRERVVGALRREPIDRIPYIEHLFDPRVALGIAAEQGQTLSDAVSTEQLASAGRDAINDEGLMKSVTLLEPAISQLVGRENISFWGAMTPFANGQTYLLDPEQAHLESSADGLVKSMRDIENLEFAPLGDEFVQSAEKFLETRGDLAACAMLWLGIDPVWHSMGFEHFSISLVTEPQLVEAFMDRITDWLAEAARLLCEAGFDFIWAADDIAYKSAPFFSPDHYRQHLLPYTRKVAQNISLPWAYHSDGNLLPILDDLISQGMNAIHPLEPGSMDLDHLKQKYGHKLAFVGNINVDTLSTGTPDEVEAEVKERIAQLGPGGGYLLSSSNSVADYCDPKNVMRMVEALHKYGHYPLNV